MMASHAFLHWPVYPDQAIPFWPNKTGSTPFFRLKLIQPSYESHHAVELSVNVRAQRGRTLAHGE